jgi:WD40 repeat protein
LEGKGAVFDLAFSRDGTHLIGAYGYSGLVAWKREGRTGLKEESRVPTRSFAAEIFFSPDGGTLAAVVWTNSIRTYAWPGMKPGPALEEWAYGAAFAPDGRIAVGTRGAAMTWRPGDAPVTFTEGVRPSAALAFSPDGGSVAFDGKNEGVLWLRHLATGKQRVYVHPGGSIRSLAFSPDGRTLVAGGESGTVRLYDVSPGKE